MNRRDFTRGLATFGLAPIVPLPSIAVGSTKTAVAAASAEHMYFMGWYSARMNTTCSTDFLIKKLNISPDVAGEIFNKLVQSKTISAPNALGVSRTLDPLAHSLARSTRAVARQARSKIVQDVEHKVANDLEAPLVEEDRVAQDSVDLELEDDALVEVTRNAESDSENPET